jgi:hypothetical protein
MKASVDPSLDQIRRLPFVKGLDFSPETRSLDTRTDGILKVHTPKGIYTFVVEHKRSYLDRGILNALIAHAKQSDQKRHAPLLLLARYLPNPSAQRLIDAGVNFLDQAGNMHLVLGGNYERTIIGNKENVASRERPRVSPAGAQLLFTLVSMEQAQTWTVRQLAEASGLGKSNVANVQQQLVGRGILKKSGRVLEVRDKSPIEEELLKGYELDPAPQTSDRTFSFPTKRIRRHAYATQRSFSGPLDSVVGDGRTRRICFAEILPRTGIARLHPCFLRSASSPATNPS